MTNSMAWVPLLLSATMVVAGCAHSPGPERRVYVISEDASGVGGSGGHDCDEEHIQCFDRCWNKAPPLTSIKKGSGMHNEYCTTLCREEYMDCIEEQEQEERERKNTRLRFSDMDAALGWLRTHKAEVALGTVVVVAGVAFIVSTGGAGALILAPLAL
ncbi:MAG TPA: hypothetical protein VE153_34775 [Myxococcus sp.]|nr:hypothetical protein [Myxococcus sp.]